MRPNFRYRIWRPRPEFRKVKADIERLPATHTILEDHLVSEAQPDIDREALTRAVYSRQHVADLAVTLNLEEDDIIVCNGEAFRVCWPFDVEMIGVVDASEKKLRWPPNAPK